MSEENKVALQNGGGDKVADGTAEFTIRKISNTAKLDENNTYEPTNTVNYVNTTKTSINSGGLEFYGGKDEYNALFQLIGRDAKEFSGAFRLLARNKEKSAELRGMLDGINDGKLYKVFQWLSGMLE